MNFYSVHAPPDAPSDPERLILVKDGFSWPAFFLPALWILWHRLWLTLVGYVIFVLVVAWAGRLAGDDAAVTLAIVGAILFGLEANNFRRWSLEARGFMEVGGTFGRDLEEAEIRFLDQWQQQSPNRVRRADAIARAAYSPAAREHGADEPILGLFPEPER
jgi:hypothetical protein